MRSWLRFPLALLLWVACGGVWAQQEVPVPALSGRVIDQTATLGEPQRAALEAKLAALEASSGAQVVVLMVPTTLPEDIADYTQRVGDTWKLGRRDIGDGALIVVAKNDRRMRIAVAKSLEGAVPDLAANQIIDGAMRPAFKANDFAGGLNSAVDQLGARIKAEKLPAPQRDQWGGSGHGGPLGDLGIEELAIFFFVAVPILGAVLTGFLGRKLGSVATSLAAGGLGYAISTSLVIGLAAGVVALVLIGVFGIGAAGRRAAPSSYRHGGGPVIWGGGGGGFGGGGFGGGGGGGDGFSSGGGGDFGGGGSSGSW